MKKILFAAAFAVCASMAFVACSGNGGEDTQTPGEITAITLSVDKESIEANGEDAVHFTVVTDTGVDITGQSGLRIMIPATQTFLDGMEYTSIMNETLVFQARYQGIYSNEVTVTVQNRAQYEKFVRKVLISQMTSTGCTQCPNMTTVLKNLSAIYPDRLQVLSFHSDYNSAVDPFSIDAANTLYSLFGASGLPSAVVDMRTLISGAVSAQIQTQILRSLRDYPATCGVKIVTEYKEATKNAIAAVTVQATEANTYSIGAAVVLDGQSATGQAAQSGADASYVHNNIVLAISNLYGDLIDGGQIGKDESKMYKFTFDLSDPKYDAYDRSQMRIVAFVLAQDGENFYVNNSATCALLNGSVDYALN